jgi:hypothetical protein
LTLIFEPQIFTDETRIGRLHCALIAFFKGTHDLARLSHTVAAHLANHLAASGFVLPYDINLDMP